jgi:hypothetical protein
MEVVNYRDFLVLDAQIWPFLQRKNKGKAETVHLSGTFVEQ